MQPAIQDYLFGVTTCQQSLIRCRSERRYIFDNTNNHVFGNAIIGILSDNVETAINKDGLWLFIVNNFLSKPGACHINVMLKYWVCVKPS